MRKLIVMVLLMISVALPIGVFAADTFVEDNLAVIDEYQHSSDKFSLILDTIRDNHPKYTRERIGILIVTAYHEVRKFNPNVSVYDVADGVKRFAADNIGLDLQDLVVSYIKSQSGQSGQ